jgi:hypothetical protein
MFEGKIGADARAMGVAILPLYACFAPMHELFPMPEGASKRMSRRRHDATRVPESDTAQLHES